MLYDLGDVTAKLNTTYSFKPMSNLQLYRVFQKILNLSICPVITSLLAPAIIASTCFISSSISAAERYPTSSEIKTIRQKFRQQIAKMKSDKYGSGLMRDRRSAKARQDMNSFVKSWSKVDPSIAPFLGSWGGDWLFYIYPSKKSQKVCVISSDEGQLSFDLYGINNGVIRRGGGQIILREDSYIGIGEIQNGKPEFSNQIPFGSPTLPRSITEVVNSSAEEQGKKDSIRQSFKENGCTTATPN
jgi:hypothetical protein